MPHAPPEPRRRMPRELTPKTDLGRRLLAFIKAKGFASVQEAADHITAKARGDKGEAIGYQQLYDIVSGRRVPRVDTLEWLVAKLGGSMVEFYAMRLPPKRK